MAIALHPAPPGDTPTPLPAQPTRSRLTDLEAPQGAEPRPFCYTCHKPQAFCLCALAKPIDNICGITILQHPRERHHPIGTARLVRLGLRRVEVAVCWNLCAPTALRTLDHTGWGVLFPSPNAIDLGALGNAGAPAPSASSSGAAQPAVYGAAQRPTRLVVLDGTWAHARSLYRQNPWLWDLPHYRITPEGPDRYRIRKEPKAEYTSTLEAIVTALMRIEPETPGLAGILTAFDTMIDRQVTCIETLHEGARRRLKPRSRPRSRGIPEALVARPLHNVVAFVEFMQHTADDKTTREMVYLTAVHLGTGQTFARFVRPAGPGPSPRHLGHMRLTAETTQIGAVAPDALGVLWRAFVGPQAHILAWNQASLDLVMPISGAGTRGWLLKAMFAAAHKQRGGTLGDAMTQAGLVPDAAAAQGRAGIRLGSAVAIAQMLIARGAAAHQMPQATSQLSL